jgi:hypothetical protein
MLESEEFAGKLADSDESELLNTDESRYSDFHVQEDGMLLPDIGDDGDGGSVCMTDSSYTAEESL